MFTYHVFGGTLESEIEFPELQPSSGMVSPQWRLRLGPTLSSQHNDTVDGDSVGERLGEDQVEPAVAVRSYRTAQGYQLVYEDTGTFDVSADGRDIVWSPTDHASSEAARMDVLGRVLGVALHAAGRFVLHGSGVAISGQGIGFLAPKFGGKSTLALALVNAGAELLTDDTLPVDLDAEPNAWPGVHSARLFQDSAQRLELVEAVANPAFAVKHTLSTLAAPRIRSRAAPLVALYLLAPTTPNPTTASVQRMRVAPLAATVELVRHTKVGALLRRTEAATVLDRASIVASRVPVYRLEVVRDFAQLDLVVKQIIRWHSETSSDAAC